MNFLEKIVKIHDLISQTLKVPMMHSLKSHKIKFNKNWSILFY